MRMRADGVLEMETWPARASVLRCCAISCSCARRERCSATDSAGVESAEKGRFEPLDVNIIVAPLDSPSVPGPAILNGPLAAVIVEVIRHDNASEELQALVTQLGLHPRPQWGAVTD